MISDMMNVRSVSGVIPGPPDLIPVSHHRDPVLVRTRVSHSSPRLNVWRETEAWHRSRRQSGEAGTANQSPASVRGDQSAARHEMSAAELKSFEVTLRRRLSERYGPLRERGSLGQRCKSVQTLDTGERWRDMSHVGRGRPLSLDLGHRVVPCGRVTVRACDEPYEEFRRAGIGACFRGEQRREGAVCVRYRQYCVFTLAGPDQRVRVSK